MQILYRLSQSRVVPRSLCTLFAFFSHVVDIVACLFCYDRFDGLACIQYTVENAVQCMFLFCHSFSFTRVCFYLRFWDNEECREFVTANRSSGDSPFCLQGLLFVLLSMIVNFEEMISVRRRIDAKLLTFFFIVRRGENCVFTSPHRSWLLESMMSRQYLSCMANEKFSKSLLSPKLSGNLALPFFKSILSSDSVCVAFLSTHYNIFRSRRCYGCKKLHLFISDFQLWFFFVSTCWEAFKSCCAWNYCWSK